MPLDAALKALADEAVPPDVRRMKAGGVRACRPGGASRVFHA